MISGANINLDFLYLVNKKDLKGILETGIIKKSKKDSNYNNKIFLMRDTSTSENAEDIKVLVLKNIESNKLCDSPVKIWSVIKRGEENNSEYELYGISIKNYLYKRYSYKKKKEEAKAEEKDSIEDINEVTDYTINLDKIVEAIVDGIIEERKEIQTNYDVMFDSNKNYLESMIEIIMKGKKNNKNLIISKRKNKIFLPYTVDEIDDYMRYYPGSYVSSSDVVKKEFTINYSALFKHQYKARFEEAYNLMRNRENKCAIFSFIKALRISLKRKLNPAIIAACKSKKELKKYLVCLKRKELENFEAFKIIYELANT